MYFGVQPSLRGGVFACTLDLLEARLADDELDSPLVSVASRTVGPINLGSALDPLAREFVRDPSVKDRPKA